MIDLCYERKSREYCDSWRADRMPSCGAKVLMSSGDVASAVVYIASPQGPRTWRVLELTDPASTVASSLWIDGRATEPSFDMRMHRAWASVFGSAYAPVAITLTPDLDWTKPSVALRNRARDLISLFVQTYKSLPDQIARLSYAAAH